MSNVFKLSKIPLLFAITSIAFYISFAYDLERSDFIKLITLYCALFLIAYLYIEKWKQSFGLLVGFGITFRVIFLFAIPNLSQDFYRFIWDGHLMAQGVNPYLFTPTMYFNDLSISQDIIIPNANNLYRGMGALSGSHFSNYPPINQFLFTIAALIGGKSILSSIMVLRVLIILADVGILYFGKKILRRLKLPVNNIFWYFLNPFIIIELTGNLHFEGVMLFLLIWSLYSLFKRKWLWAAVLFGISISVKLIPLLFLPLFFRYFGSKNKIPRIFESYEVSIKKLIEFYLIVGVTVVVTFLPFLSVEFMRNFTSTLALWFQDFEFNASVYYIIRWIGFQVVGWNIIGIIGKIIPIIVFLLIMGIAFFRRNNTREKLLTAMLFAISIYFLLATTVHPWYIATPLLLSVFTRYKFPIVWSLMVMLSYSAYGKDGVDENLWLVALEYFVVIGFAIWEIYFRPKESTQIYKGHNQID
ncbi:DUF2029 domain-containing protein [Aequorivita sp. H23M31]|uniref:DUF2029 domain-containing protein n=1 Tax=Aequorivita ciconiae TaxID=2494375 RepID=A0A410G5N1_9FLAO|nr:glycosyltransferase 87 family protein [Aequorivita sp. H23M31]QAA82586.1 DUF2029 domain-containing protein [Aequorivita sp. H23M31]